MYFSKKATEEIQNIIVDTSVYSCESDSCNGWMRKEFASDDLSCPMCGSGMREEMRQLPEIRTDFNPFKYN
ncbi:hypothetical protein CU633_15090 [Bacillus sp. V3-13]|uniref:cold-inducible protein YdjO-related protein n=1 Tax=Bacillus sp. V3-13 TaxID=2053728 RepID=UPI000C78C0F3|nr:cold-inducible protein YdjO-related protein [Bacillus sp. V3-13]PLR76671.1 hypothetical protein CU633_15090 [Bacillus sp. V3-13]